jgi:ATP-dependent exoDNAse (exonuclease V) beta subunit
MTKPFQENIVDEILSQMPLQEKVALANMESEDVDLLQGIFDYYIRNRADPDDEDYENIIHELWQRVRKTHRLRVIK